MSLSIPDMPERAHHNRKDMAEARENLARLTNMAPFLEPVRDDRFPGVPKSPDVGHAWLDCTFFFRDYYQLGAPPWMHSRFQLMRKKFWMLQSKARKLGYDQFTLD